MIQVGDLVTAKHWSTGYIGLVVSVRDRGNDSRKWGTVCRVIMNNGYEIDQLTKDLEKIQ